ncbi:MAG: HlyD family efflux transporter periplasmic adaptor subunit [Pirellulaceae bacterium]|nr:HlyD family efflux transporter periplasmic adaptor subunit [Planctomycetales bacterium]
MAHVVRRHRRHLLARGNRHPNGADRGVRGVSIMSVLAVLVVVAALATGGWMYLRGGRGTTLPDVIPYKAERGPFRHDVVERGEVESSRNIEVRCEVKSRNSSGIAIIDVVDEGTHVQEGDVLIRFDSSALEQELVQQQIVCNSAEATEVEARNTFESAEIAKKEYIEGTYHQEEQQIQSEVFIAEENLRRAQEYLTYSERLAAKGYVTAQQLEGDRFAVEKARTELDAAKTRLRVLQEYTKVRMLKQLDTDIKSAEAKWKSAQSSFALEKSKLDEIESQIKKCTVQAPQAGQVVYANEQSSRSGSEFIVEPGAMVREQQTVIKLPDPELMQVKTKISESRITNVRQGMPASIRLDAFGDELLKGEVTRVNEYPEPSSWYSSQVKEYAAFVRIDIPGSRIRPGLTSEVTIHVRKIEDALQVPVQAIHEHGAKFYVMVRNGEAWEAREIVMDATNDKFAVISQGLSEGDVVALNPRVLVPHVDLPEISRQSEVAGGVQISSDAPPETPRRRVASGGEGGGGGGGGPGGAGGGGFNPQQIVNTIFANNDADGDGKLSSSEIPAEQAGRMAGADANGDGSVDRQELMQMFQRRAAEGGGQGGPRGPGGQGGPR